MFDLYFWLVLGVICILCELLTMGFFLLSIGIGSFSAAVLNYSGFDPISQIAIFVIVTVICIILSRPLSKRLTKNTPGKKVGSERLVGEEGLVLEDISENKIGTVKIIGDTWKASSNEEILEGEKVKVEEIKGTRLIVTKKIFAESKEE
ncbi:MAG: NfeD family protein [Methanobacteriaceae archaeon]